MTRGVLLFAHNNDVVDYVKQAIYCASNIKKYLNLPVSIATSNDIKGVHNFDQVIKIDNPNSKQIRKFYDGQSRTETLWSNHTRTDAFQITPYDETIVMDTDFIVQNKNLSKVFQSNEDFLINYQAQHIDFDSKYTKEMKYVSDTGIEMCWATVFYFKKTKRVKKLFEYINHIKDHWQFYRFRYQLLQHTYRNDFAFAIAIHTMNGYQKGVWPKQLPIKLLYVTDKDIILNKKENGWKFKHESGLISSIEGINIHIMNKIALNRVIENG